MLNSQSFIKYRSLLISEVIGNGQCVYEYLIENFNGAVAKIMINANSVADCENYFKRRFTIRAVTSQEMSSANVGNFYTYDKILNSNQQRVFSSVVCRRVF